MTMWMSDSDNESEDRKKILEALHPGFKPDEGKPKAVRPENDLDVTPEFQSFISRKLSKLIDRNLEEEKVENSCRVLQTGGDSGIFLFSNSKEALTLSVDSSESTHHQKHRSKPCIESDDSSEEEAKIKESVVTSDWLMQHSAFKPTWLETASEGEGNVRKNRLN